MILEYDFNIANGSNSWKRVGVSHSIDLYYGKDENGNNAIEFIGDFVPNRKIQSSVIINITHYKLSDGKKSIVFSLTDKKFLHPFCDFLNSIIETTKTYLRSNQDAYQAVCEVYFVMQKMFRATSDILQVSEIKGLIGELLFLRDILTPKYGIDRALVSWGGAEKAHKDFSLDQMWYEIKTIDSGKETVHISSIEQLDSEVEGELVIYQLESMTEEYDGITLNKVVSSIYKIISSLSNTDVFTSKLQDAHYIYHPRYDEYVYEVRAVDEYRVNSMFPRISRKNIPSAVSKASFDLIIAELSSFKK